eukprot:scaffold20668_cov79-Isochrysis_galbana.AAC.1
MVQRLRSAQRRLRSRHRCAPISGSQSGFSCCKRDVCLTVLRLFLTWAATSPHLRYFQTRSSSFLVARRDIGFSTRRLFLPGPARPPVRACPTFRLASGGLAATHICSGMPAYFRLAWARRGPISVRPISVPGMAPLPAGFSRRPGMAS